MSSREIEPTVKQSILDRLINSAPQVARDPPSSWSESVQQLRMAVRRDLEWLLNTRRIIEPVSNEYPELRASVYHYGLPDVTSLSGDSEETPLVLARQMEECIQMFEPRLSSIRVVPAESDSDTRHRIRFIIEALLDMEPEPEHVVFDTTLEVTSGEFEVSGSSDA